MLLILSVFSFANTHCSNFDWISVAWSVPTFIVTITTLIEHSCPLSADQTCFSIENILLPQHLKQVYNEFSRASCGFSSWLITRFIFSLAESKTGCSKIGSMFVSTIFLCTFKINMDKTSQKVTNKLKRQ